jgi:tRNA dimethylallyltransferase
MNPSEIIFIVGPTAVGKTEVAALLAEKVNGEIVSCDAMQVYKDIAIASNKPPKKILQKTPHHMLGIIPINKDFDVASYRRRALLAIRKVQHGGAVPVVCGGSGLYMSVLLDGIFEGGTKNDTVRFALEKEAELKGDDALYVKLKKVDPKAAQKIHPHDRRRVIRALEVFSVSGRPISALQPRREGLWGQYDISVFALNRPREELYEAVNRRVDQMVEEGLVDEIRSLMKRKWSRTAEKIIGVKEIKEYLRGGCTLEQAKEATKLNTRRYAKRQLTWFRKDKRLQWILIPKGEPVWKTVSRIRVILKNEKRKSPSRHH